MELEFRRVRHLFSYGRPGEQLLGWILSGAQKAEIISHKAAKQTWRIELDHTGRTSRSLGGRCVWLTVTVEIRCLFSCEMSGWIYDPKECRDCKFQPLLLTSWIVNSIFVHKFYFFDYILPRLFIFYNFTQRIFTSIRKCWLLLNRFLIHREPGGFAPPCLLKKSIIKIFPLHHV